MNWIRVSKYAGQCGIWIITELITAGVSKFLLYRKDEIVGRFDSKDAAKAMASALQEKAAA